MKKIITFIFILMIAGSVAAQDDNNDIFVSKGNKSILFSFSGLDNLNANAFNGGIGGKYYLSDMLAVRVGLQFNSFSETTPANPDTTEKGIDGERSSLIFGFSAALEWHITRGRVSPYLGGGVGYSTGSIDYFSPIKWPRTYPYPVIKTTYEISGVSAFEIFGIGGVEFFITKSVSLAAEYHLSYRSFSEGELTTTESLVNGTDSRFPRSEKEEGSTSNTFGFTTGGYLTLAVYF